MLAAATGLHAQAAPPDPAFDIHEFDVEGNTVLPAREVERAVYPFLGDKRHFADVEGARKALEAVYQKLGYQTVFVDIPEQQVVGGVIRLHVLQGRVGQLKVAGSRYFELGRIRSRVTELEPGNVPEFNALQQQLAQVNKLPDRQVAPILTPGRVPGTVDVDLSVKDKLPLHGEITLDNHASPFTTSLRTSASLHYDNLWQRQHSIAINYQLAPEKPSEANVLYATYLWRFADHDDVLSVYGIRSNSRIALVGSATILGDAKIAGVRWIKPLGSGSAMGGTFFNTLTLGIDHKGFGQTNIDAQSGSADLLPPISYAPLSVTYGGLLSRADATIQLSLGASTAPRGILGNSDNAFRGRRVTGGASFVAWKYDLSAEAWWTRRFSTLARVSGQWTGDALIANEQFNTGGAESVRGYRESEIVGDHGFQSSLELRYYPWNRPQPDGRWSLSGLWFFDAGGVGLVDPLGTQVSSATIASTGFGLRLTAWRDVRLDLNAAQALRDGGHGVSGPITAKGARRVDFSLGMGF